MTSAFWGALTAGRFVAIFVSMRVGAPKLLVAALAACALTAGALAVSPANAGVTWLFCALFGLAQASVYPTTISYLEGFFHVHGRHATVLAIGAGVGDWLLPFIITSLFGGHVTATGEAMVTDTGGPGPAIMIYVVAVGCILNLAVLVALRRQCDGFRAGLVAAASGGGGRSKVGSGKLAVGVGHDDDAPW
jgi:MFS family permease